MQYHADPQARDLGRSMQSLIEGDCLEVMRKMDDESVDAVVTDPPYGINFMGKAWDGSAIAAAVESQKGNSAFQEWTRQWAEQGLRVLKPGGHLIAFAGTRTYHRMASGVEDAGFEIRDCIAWMFGSGFPKSRNLDGDRKGWGTALKPAFEPIVVARKPLAEHRNHHPTVKPIDVMRWLVRLVTPPDGLVLDPFTGSGTTGCAAALEGFRFVGFRFVGIEREPDYADIARRRIAWWAKQPVGQPTAKVLVTGQERSEREARGEMSIFDLTEEAA